MKITGLIGTTTLLFLFGIAVPAYGQEQHEDQPKQQVDPAKTPNDHADKEARPPKEEPKAEKPKTDRTTQVQEEKDRKAEQDTEHRQDAQHRDDAKRAGRIPDDKFRAHFGREHTFHVGHPVIVEGRPRFQYGGYSFIIAEPWPAGWGYDDEVYVMDIDGVYYLVNVRHPETRLALTVVL